MQHIAYWFHTSPLPFLSHQSHWQHTWRRPGIGTQISQLDLEYYPTLPAPTPMLYLVCFQTSESETKNVYILYMYHIYIICSKRIWYTMMFMLLILVIKHMMTSSNGDIFRVAGPLCGEFTGHRWIPLTKASNAELWRFLWSAPEQTVE